MPGSDITGMTAYSLQQCIDACSTMNDLAGERRCIAVALNGDLAEWYKANKGANCWLKNASRSFMEETRVTVAMLT